MDGEAAHRGLGFVFLLALFAPVPLAGCGSSHASEPANPKSAALRASELPTPVASVAAGYWSPGVLAQEDRLPPSLLQAHGLVRSYHNGFFRTLIDNMPVNGVVRADSTITQWKTVAGARWYFSRLVPSIRRSGVLGTTTSGTNVGQASYTYPYKPLSIPRIGDESAGFEAYWAGDEFSYTSRAIAFRQGVYVVKLRVVGHQHEVPVATSITLARNIDRRLGG